MSTVYPLRIVYPVYMIARYTRCRKRALLLRYFSGCFWMECDALFL